MSEMYEYFEDFPEENPANYVGERFDPAGAKRLRAQKDLSRKEQSALDTEIHTIIEKAKQSSKQRDKAD